MTYRGRIQGGVVVFEEQTVLPEGATVEVHLVRPRREGPFEPNPELLKYAGIADDLPEDASQSIDRVHYGAPRE